MNTTAQLNNVYTRIEKHPHDIEPCPCCGHPAAVYELLEDDMIKRAVMCERESGWGGLENGCPMNYVNGDFYYPRIKQAVETWNAFAVACRVAKSCH